MPRNKHLSDYDRGIIEQLLHDRAPLREIAARLGKHRTTIWRCARLAEEPFVCNGCPDERRCTLRKRHCVRDAAQRQYRRILSESRSGADATEQELAAMNALLPP